ncbi:hypothetical protein IAQ61_008084 [Plenodomus lingam]|uniref:uncharacterized protein n=1 Tax=Leptosphaeria maculans TaxID=5022 RepID=UPI00331B59EE|nr:hypothetical protein IAQ61_008084 [Plenodomus lingam]
MVSRKSFGFCSIAVLGLDSTVVRNRGCLPTGTIQGPNLFRIPSPLSVRHQPTVSGSYLHWGRGGCFYFLIAWWEMLVVVVLTLFGEDFMHLRRYPPGLVEVNGSDSDRSVGKSWKVSALEDARDNVR